MKRDRLIFGALLAVPLIFAGLRPSDVGALRRPYFAPVSNYNPIAEIRTWPDNQYFLDWGARFVGSQSPLETYFIKSMIELDRDDEKARSNRLMLALGLDAGALTLVGGFEMLKRTRRKSQSSIA